MIAPYIRQKQMAEEARLATQAQNQVIPYDNSCKSSVNRCLKDAQVLIIKCTFIIKAKIYTY